MDHKDVAIGSSDACTGWEPESGPLKEQGMWCKAWGGSKVPWCWVNKDHKDSNGDGSEFVKTSKVKGTRGKYFAPCFDKENYTQYEEQQQRPSDDVTKDTSMDPRFNKKGPKKQAGGGGAELDFSNCTEIFMHFDDDDSGSINGTELRHGLTQLQLITVLRDDKEVTQLL